MFIRTDASGGAPRYAFLDLYRGIIVLLMIEGHVVRELLDPIFQQSKAFLFHEVVHGITGPGFLFGAGITFGLSAQRRWDDFLAWTPVLKRRLRKISLLIVTGYALHLPYLSLRKTLAETSEEGWGLLFSFDVLQCIGFSLAVVQLLILALRRERWFALSILGLTLGVLTVTPAVWPWVVSSELPPYIRAALEGTSGSAYPLVPYSAFLFAGALASYEFRKFARMGMEAVFLKRLAIMGLLLNLAGAGFEAFPFTIYRESDFWHTSPNFLLMKLGGLFVLMSGLWHVETNARSWTGWIRLLGTESLVVYILHLLVIYGSVANAELHLSAFWKHSLDWWTSLGLAVFLTGVLYGFARIWNELRARHLIVLRMFVWWMVIVFGYEFMTRPY